MGDYLELDDAQVWASLHSWESARRPELRDLSRRLRVRDLFKTHELVGEQAEPGPSVEALARAQEVAADHDMPESYVGLDIASETPLSADDDPPRVAMSDGRTRPLHEVSFLLGRLYGATFSEVRLIFPAELRDPIRRALAS